MRGLAINGLTISIEGKAKKAKHRLQIQDLEQ